MNLERRMPEIAKDGKQRAGPGLQLYQVWALELGCALTFASEAKFEIEAKISFRLEAKKKPDFT